MGDSCVESSEAPAWLSKLESQREKLSKARLGHDSGAGAPCNSCGSECPGLDLHFWRKVCRACHCSKDVHDVQDDELSGWAQFELLGTARPKKSTFPLIKIRGVADVPVKLDWAPPDVSADLVSDYMSCLGDELAPVVGSEAARKWRAQLRTQLPPHDVRVNNVREDMTEHEKESHQEYISRIKSHVVGRGNVVRIGNLEKGDTLSLETGTTHTKTGAKSYALPIKISNVSKGVKYNIVPKNTSDKKLVLDNMGNVVNSMANLPDYKQAPTLSRVVKDRLTAMRIESDRIKSAVEHGPIYDRLLKDLKTINVPVDNDVYLAPIKIFRDEYKRNPFFKEETVKFATQHLGAKPLDDNFSVNNNEVLKGTVFGPNGEIWSWKYDTTPEMVGAQISSFNPNIVSSAENVTVAQPQMSRALANDDDVPPPLNYETYPGHADLLPERLNDMHLGAEATTSLCRRCNEPLLKGQVGVKAERAGDDSVWHPQCFSCLKCNQLLADLVYFYYNGDIYCARDLANVLEIPRCAGCDELIFTRTYTAAEGRTFHLQHFCCYHCDAPLGGNKYVPDDKTGLPICLRCYDEFHAERCQACAGIIGPEQQGVSWSKFHWHATCFICSGRHCGKSLLSGKFVVKNDMPFCSTPCVQSMVK